MPTNRRHRSKMRAELSIAEFIELGIGNGGRPSCFESEEDKREAWFLHREEILTALPAGKVPAAMRQFEPSR